MSPEFWWNFLRSLCVLTFAGDFLLTTGTRIAKPGGTWLRRFFVREDPIYDGYASTYQAKSTPAKVVYLVLYLLPGILGYVLINIGPVFRTQLHLTGLSSRNLQYAWLLIFAMGWHMFVPFIILRYTDRLTVRQSFEFLGLNRVDWRGLLLVLPVYCAAFALISVPYMTFIWPPLFRWLQAVPAFGTPSYSIFQGASLYNFSPFALAFLFIGNFVGEELYFRGYLMKKTAFLGRMNWIVNSLLFAMYHLWQIPPTWASIGLILSFGLLMSLRKDLWVLVAFHFFVNMWLTFGEYPVAHLIGLR
jgi:CAAX protease family protein